MLCIFHESLFQFFRNILQKIDYEAISYFSNIRICRK